MSQVRLPGLDRPRGRPRRLHGPEGGGAARQPRGTIPHDSCGTGQSVIVQRYMSIGYCAAVQVSA